MTCPDRGASNDPEHLRLAFHQGPTFINTYFVIFDLTKKEYRPYTKPGNSHLYVHTESNHPPTIAKRIPKSIEARLSNISSNEAIFNKAKPAYERALRTARHRTTLNYQPKNPNTQNPATPKTKRQRNITWYNPQYSAHVKSNIGKKFLALIKQHFPPNHELQQICNKNTLKLSYSCMNNMGNIIKAHNNRILKATNNQPEDKCNCRNKDNCPLPGKCTTQNVIYEATVTTPNNSKKYIGLTANTFKTRYTAHKATFTKREKENSTELSKHIWKLKDQNTPFETTWRILKHAQPYTPSTKKMRSMHMGEILHNNSRERQHLELPIITDIHMPTQKKIPTL